MAAAAEQGGARDGRMELPPNGMNPNDYAPRPGGVLYNQHLAPASTEKALLPSTKVTKSAQR